MSFLNPTYLWALLGLAIPIAIHLWSKKEGKTIKVGSIKLLQSADSKQSSSIQINEYILLALRLLLITILVLIIATPQLRKSVVTQPLTYIIEPELLDHTALEPLLDSLQDLAPLRVLHDGFPEVKEFTNHRTIIPDYWELVRQFQDLPADSIVVFTRGLKRGIKGKRPKTHKKIAWVILDIEDPVDQYIAAVRSEDSIQLLALKSNAEQLSFRKERLPLTHSRLTLNSSGDSLSIGSREGKTISRKQKEQKIPVTQSKPITIGLVVDDSLIVQARYMEAAFRALGSYLHRSITVERIEDISTIGQKAYDCLVWLSNRPLVQIDGKMLVYQSDPFAASLIEEGPSQNIFYLTQPLDVENSINEHLVAQLLPLLELHSGIETRITPYDKRVVAKASLFPTYEEKQFKRSEVVAEDVSPWLWSIFLIVLFIERSLARYRKQ